MPPLDSSAISHHSPSGFAGRLAERKQHRQERWIRNHIHECVHRWIPAHIACGRTSEERLAGLHTKGQINDRCSRTTTHLRINQSHPEIGAPCNLLSVHKVMDAIDRAACATEVAYRPLLSIHDYRRQRLGGSTTTRRDPTVRGRR
jgi:hypothetical protein